MNESAQLPRAAVGREGVADTSDGDRRGLWRGCKFRGLRGVGGIELGLGREKKMTQMQQKICVRKEDGAKVQGRRWGRRCCCFGLGMGIGKATGPVTAVTGHTGNAGQGPGSRDTFKSSSSLQKGTWNSTSAAFLPPAVSSCRAPGMQQQLLVGQGIKARKFCIPSSDGSGSRSGKGRKLLLNKPSLPGLVSQGTDLLLS